MTDETSSGLFLLLFIVCLIIVSTALGTIPEKEVSPSIVYIMKGISCEELGDVEKGTHLSVVEKAKAGCKTSFQFKAPCLKALWRAADGDHYEAICGGG